MRTCRSSSFQKKVRAACGCAASCVPLAALVVGVEDEAALVERLEQHDARRRAALRVDRGERHGRGLRHLRLERLGEPGVELLEGVGVDVGLVEALEGVVLAQVGDVHGGFGRGAVPFSPRPYYRGKGAPPHQRRSCMPRRAATSSHPWLALYLPGVPAEVDISATPTLVHLIDEAAARHGPRDQAVLPRPVVHLRARRSRRARVRGVARGAAASGRARASAIMMPNVPQYAAAVFGVLRAGATVVNVNPLFTARELAAQLADAEVAAIVVLENFAATLAQAMTRTPADARAWSPRVGDWLGPVKGPVANFVLRHVRKAVRPWAIEGAVRFDEALARGLDARLRRRRRSARRTSRSCSTPAGRPACRRARCSRMPTWSAAVLASEAWLAPAFAGRAPRRQPDDGLRAAALSHLRAGGVPAPRPAPGGAKPAHPQPARPRRRSCATCGAIRRTSSRR